MKRKDRIVLKTALAMFVLLLFFFAQGALVVITGIDGVPSALIRGAVIWGLVAVTLAYSVIRYKGISKLGFRGAEKGAAKRMLYFSPLLLIAFSPFAAGVDWNGEAPFLFANLFLTLGIGMAEEIFFRGIICGLWLKHGTVKAMMTLLHSFRVQPYPEYGRRREAWGDASSNLLRAGLRNGICPDFCGKRQYYPLRTAPRPARLLLLHQRGWLRAI